MLLLMLAALAPSCLADELLSLDVGDKTASLNLRLLDSSTGASTTIVNYPSAAGSQNVIALAHDPAHSETIMVDGDSITTVDRTGSVLSSVKQDHASGPVVSLGYNANTTQLFGIRQQSFTNVSLVSVDRTGLVITELLTLNVRGSVLAAYYAPPKGHYCLVVRPVDGSADQIVFIDTAAVSIHKQGDVQPGLSVTALAINYVTRNVYALVADTSSYRTALSLVVLHMNGTLQETVATLPVGVRATPLALVDNAANVLYAVLHSPDPTPGRPPWAPVIAAFDLAAGRNGELTTAPLAYEPGALTLRAAQ